MATTVSSLQAILHSLKPYTHLSHFLPRNKICILTGLLTQATSMYLHPMVTVSRSVQIQNTAGDLGLGNTKRVPCHYLCPYSSLKICGHWLDTSTAISNSTAVHLSFGILYAGLLLGLKSGPLTEGETKGMKDPFSKFLQVSLFVLLYSG